MADDTNPTEPVRPSGNRWEPTPAPQTPAAQTPAAQTPADRPTTTPPAAGAVPPAAPTEPAARKRRFSPGSAGVLAGTAAGALILGGLSGLGVGYVVGDHDNHTGDRSGWGEHGPGERGFDRDGDGDGFMPPGGAQQGPFQGELPDDQQQPDQTSPSGSTSS